MRLLREAEHGVRLHKGECLELGKFEYTDNVIDWLRPLLLPLSRAQDLVLHQRWDSGLEKKGAGGGQG